MTDTKKAINWDKTEVCLEESLVIDNAKLKKRNIMISFYKHYNLICLSIIGLLIAFGVYMVLSASLLVCLTGVFIIAASIIAIPFVCSPKWLINDKIESQNNRLVYTDDFMFFAREIKNAYSYDLFYIDFFVLKDEYNAHMMYKLFVLIDTYAMESFIKAASNNDKQALTRLVTPFIEQITKETEKAYATHLEIERTFKKRQEADLNAQIDLDLAIFEKKH